MMEPPSCSNTFNLTSLRTHNLDEHTGDRESFQSIDLDSPSSEDSIAYHPETISLDIWQLKTWAQQEDQPSSNDDSQFLDSEPNHQEAPFPINEEINNKICLW